MFNNMEKDQTIFPELTPEQKRAQIQAEIEKLNKFIEGRTKINEKEVELYGPKKYPDPNLSDAYEKLSELFAQLKKLEEER